MNEFNPDGEIHPISEDFAYCGKILKEDVKLDENDRSLCKTQNDFFNKYAEYLYEFDKENIIKLVKHNLYNKMFHTDEFQIIYRPYWMVGILAQNAHMLLKFKRLKNDNLDGKCQKE